MSIAGLILIAQTAASTAAVAPPDIELRAHVDIRSLEIRTQGPAQVTLHAEPGDAPPLKVERSVPPGRKKYRNLTLDILGIARLTAPEPIAAIETKTGDAE